MNDDKKCDEDFVLCPFRRFAGSDLSGRWTGICQTASETEKSASASVPDAGDPVKYFHDNKYDGVRLTTPDGIEFTVRFIRDGKPGGDIAVRKNGKPYYRQPLSTLPKKQGRNKKR